MADMYFSLQNLRAGQPAAVRRHRLDHAAHAHVKLLAVATRACRAQPMTLIARREAPGGIEARDRRRRRSYERQQHGDLPLQARRREDAGGRRGLHARRHKFRAGAFIIPDADRAALRTDAEGTRLSAWAVAAAPDVKTHDLDVPRIGYAHSWSTTQNEGWVRAAFDKFGVPTRTSATSSCARATCGRSTT